MQPLHLRCAPHASPCSLSRMGFVRRIIVHLIRISTLPSVTECTKGAQVPSREVNPPCAVVQVMTLVARGSGFVGRMLEPVVGCGMSLPPDLERIVRILHLYSSLLMLLGWNMPRARPTHAQLEVRP